MPSAVINITEMAMPAPGKKRGRVKDRDGTIYQIDPGMLAGVKNGDTCEISFYDDEFKGMKFRVIETIKSMMTGAAPGPGSMAPSSRPAPMHANPIINKDELIFVEALIKEWMSGIPIGEADALIRAVNTLRTVYAKTFGSNPVFKVPSKIETAKQAFNEEIGDEIPEFE